MPVPVRDRNKDKSALDNMKSAKIDSAMLKRIANIKGKPKDSKQS